LVATGIGLAQLTATRQTPAAKESLAMKPSGEGPAEDSIPYRLRLSAPASFIEIDTGRPIRPEISTSVTGHLSLDAANPRVGLTVRWQAPPATGEQRFAKLSLERPGQPTFHHVFDADGDIDELLELPLAAGK
jgi:hypothetical protein